MKKKTEYEVGKIRFEQVFIFWVQSQNSEWKIISRNKYENKFSMKSMTHIFVPKKLEEKKLGKMEKKMWKYEEKKCVKMEKKNCKGI